MKSGEKMAKFSRYDSRNKKQNRNKFRSQERDIKIRHVVKVKSKYNTDWTQYNEDNLPNSNNMEDVNV